MTWQKIMGTFAGIGLLIISCAIAHRIYKGANLKAQMEKWSIGLESSSQTLEELKAQLAVAEENCMKTQEAVETAQAQLSVIGSNPSLEELNSLRAAFESPVIAASPAEDFSTLQTEIDRLDAGLQEIGSQLGQNLS